MLAGAEDQITTGWGEELRLLELPAHASSVELGSPILPLAGIHPKD